MVFVFFLSFATIEYLAAVCRKALSITKLPYWAGFRTFAVRWKGASTTSSPTESEEVEVPAAPQSMNTWVSLFELAWRYLPTKVIEIKYSFCALFSPSRQGQRLQSPTIAPVRDFRELCDGVCLAYLISYYCPKLVPWHSVKFNHVPTIEVSSLLLNMWLWNLICIGRRKTRQVQPRCRFRCK